MKWINSLILFLFPVHCKVCGIRLGNTTGVLCLSCESALPRTRYYDLPDNPVSKIFWGRVPVQTGTSLICFEYGSAYRSLIHDLKYRGDRATGYYLGRLLGRELEHTSFACCDLLLPVPLHPRKLRKRGYNQSELIARGVSEVLGMPVNTTLLKRTGRQGSQTTFGRYERYENVTGSFTIGEDPVLFAGKKILLIDDVITTGATLEACCLTLSRQLECHLYVATVSYAV